MSPDDHTDLPPPAAGDGDSGLGQGQDGFDAAATDPGPGPAAEGRQETSRGDGEAEGASGAHPQFVGTGVFWGLVVGVILAIVVIVFASQNTQSAVVDVIAWKWTAPLFVIVLISLLIGIVLDEIVGLLYRSRRRRRLAERAELHRLRGKR